ncbi:uncharacterized protein LOC120459000 [Pimephales promelas]|uniref:uncharacterized protein LOC120459000 n=1 Tax=Pimephales promelas TaxID=90988 RepID=UPI0019555088|nr:uncharacterized protein LOC120459000 [Pimephales promelas]KAG1939282.1 hypothetical protein F2P79_017266 [Pimephales promelas]
MAQVRCSVAEALWGVCAADAMSMPVHWFYNTADIRTHFSGWITGFNAPRNTHPSSILRLSNTAGSGRTNGSSGDPVVGNVILHDKLKFWMDPSGSVHYHQGLLAGQNTLNALCALRAARVLSAGSFPSAADPAARAAVLSDYVEFLTSPGSHDDTYAESFHRSFFSDWREQRPTAPREVLEFAERRSRRMLNSSRSDGQLNAIGCLPIAIPFVLMSATANEEQAVCAAVEFVKLTHPHAQLEPLVSLYARALHATLNGACLRRTAEAALRSPALDAWAASQRFIQRAERFPASSDERLKVHQSAVESLGLACYTQGALTSLFYLAYCFHDDVTEGILTNTNCGGENCNRGAALGALLGARAAYLGSAVPQTWKNELRDAPEQICAVLRDLET